MRKLPDRRSGTTSPAVPPGPNAEASLSDCASGGGPSFNRQLRPDGVAREPNCVQTELAREPTWPRVASPSPEAARAPAPPRPRPTVVEPLAPGRYKVQFTASAELHDKLERLRALMRPSVPDGDLGRDRRAGRHREAPEARSPALRPDPGRRGRRSSQSDTSPTTRQIPAAVKRAVYERDGGRCRYADEQGRRCTARQGLEFHHRHPFGSRRSTTRSPTSPSRAKCHNRYLAEVDYGREADRSASPLGNPSAGADTVSVAVTIRRLAECRRPGVPTVATGGRRSRLERGPVLRESSALAGRETRRPAEDGKLVGSPALRRGAAHVSRGSELEMPPASHRLARVARSWTGRADSALRDLRRPKAYSSCSTISHERPERSSRPCRGGSAEA